MKISWHPAEIALIATGPGRNYSETWGSTHVAEQEMSCLASIS